MAGVCDLPFRLLCKEQGAALVCMEMVSAKGIFYNNKNTKSMLEIETKEKPVSLQLFGSDPDIISEMAKKIEELPFDILDINMGCPMPKIVNNGDGSALMKNPKLAGEIIEKTAKAISKPVTVKIRKGFDDDHINAVEMAHIAQESGAAAVAVARSLAYDPDMIVADEPTGNLDRETEDEIMEIFTNLAHKQNKCVIIVSHSENVSNSVDEVYTLNLKK